MDIFDIAGDTDDAVRLLTTALAALAALVALAGYVTFERQIDMTWR